MTLQDTICLVRNMVCYAYILYTCAPIKKCLLCKMCNFAFFEAKEKNICYKPEAKCVLTFASSKLFCDSTYYRGQHFSRIFGAYILGSQKLFHMCIILCSMFEWTWHFQIWKWFLNQAINTSCIYHCRIFEVS